MCEGLFGNGRFVYLFINVFPFIPHKFVYFFFKFQEHVNEIDFDYMEYAKQRFQEYWLQKPKILGSLG